MNDDPGCGVEGAVALRWEGSGLKPILAACAGLFALLTSAVADDGQPQDRVKRPAPDSLAAWIAQNADCEEFTDFCMVCRNTPDGPACSTAGAKCVKGALSCTKKKK